MANDDMGQGERDSDPRMAREQDEHEGTSGRTHSAMPDFTSGPGYTGQVTNGMNEPTTGNTGDFQQDQGQQSAQGWRGE